MQQLNPNQQKFLLWLNRNYDWMKSIGYHPMNQPYQHTIYNILIAGEYDERDKEIINYSIKFLRGLGMKTYYPEWEWKKGNAELDWLINIR